MTISARLAELGIELPPVVAPVGSYLPARTVGNLCFTSGQLPTVDGALPATGKVGAEVEVEDAQGYARQAALNALAAAADAVGSVDRLTGVVKLVGFVASDPSFSGHSKVVNGASDVFAEIFGDAGRHARSAVGMAALPLDTPVEIEVVFEFA